MALVTGTPRGRFAVLGVGVDRLDLAGAARHIAGMIAEGPVHQVVTVNPEFVIAARADPAFRRILKAADLAVADGIGIVWAARLLGDRLPERVGGIDLVERLAAQAAVLGHRLFLLGAGEGVAAVAAAGLSARFPGLIIAGTHAGDPHPDHDEEIGRLIRAARPDLLLVAFGAPAQEYWIARNAARLSVPVSVGVGGAFDFLAGRVPRAPRALRRMGLEWLYRLVRQPWRWRRMLALPRFALLVAWTALRARFGRKQ